MSPPFTPGLRLHDRFVLRERIGLGGMSEVWRADDDVLHRPVAVKALAGQLAADLELRATIQREARAAARLTHPHVTQVYDYGEATLPGGVVVPYLVMELVEGENLADRLNRGPLAWPDAVRLGGQVAAALAAAHRIGVVHHDIKPGNVMLTDTGAKVLDFGIAALAGPGHPLARRGGGEPLLGTPAYIAPERFAAGSPDPASDIYALGVLLYRTLTGRAPLPVQSWEDALAVHGRGTPVPPLGIPELPVDVDRLVMACLAADPTRRPAAVDVASRLGAGRPAHPPTAIFPTVPPPSTAPQPTLVAPVPPRVDRTLVGPPSTPGWSPRPGVDPTRVAARPPGGVPPRQSNRLIGVLVAAGVALIVGLVGVLARSDDDPSGRSTANQAGAGSSAEPAPTPVESTAPPRPAPTTAQPQPTTVRELAGQLRAIIDEAEERGDIEERAADRLRDTIEKLESDKPKDQAKGFRELGERLGEAAQRRQIDGATAVRLLTMLEQFSVNRVDAGGEEDEDD
ncbi:serine/threonine protein kinase [Micromonospora pallida]|uniref:non-specific serine/threonine protein kinase n=1 Tax=Micromonospora pallida TaxID=145854 RepID=A0A1C6SFB7_9ACTN|nr:serine/threonine-protein kinase [Micromonospora pallida]SCL28029.1 serine/threonine protein kinase [Micromonospora pallida]